MYTPNDVLTGNFFLKSLVDEGHGGVEGVYTILSKTSSKQEERRERRSPGKPEPEWPRVTAAARGCRNPEPSRGELWWGRAGRGEGWAPRSGARNADPASKQNRALGSKSSCPGDLRVINLRPPARSNFGHKLLIPRFSGRTGRRKGTQPKSSSVPFGRALGKSSA